MTGRFERSNAFSLVELLVVIAIIAIMATAGTVALTSGGNSVQSASSAAASLFTMARTEAILRRTNTLVLVDTAYNAQRPDNFLRRMTVVYSTNGGASWTQATRWTALPGNAFFNRDASAGTGTLPTTNIPSLPGANGSGPYVYYEFLPNGQTSSRQLFVVSRGTAPGGQFQEINSTNRAGFVLQRMGRPTFFQSYSEVGTP